MSRQGGPHPLTWQLRNLSLPEIGCSKLPISSGVGMITSGSSIKASIAALTAIFHSSGVCTWDTAGTASSRAQFTESIGVAHPYLIARVRCCAARVSRRTFCMISTLREMNAHQAPAPDVARLALTESASQPPTASGERDATELWAGRGADLRLFAGRPGRTRNDPSADL